MRIVCCLPAGLLGLVCAFLALPELALAQSISPSDLNIIQQQQRRIQQENEQRRQRDEQQFRSATPPQISSPLLEPAPDKQGDGACVFVGKITLNGNTVISTSDISELTHNYRDKCLTVSDLDALIKIITNAYIERGYSTTRVYIGAQDLKDGHLIITVMEGRIEDLSILEDGHPRLGFDTAFPTSSGAILNLRDIEQGLDQIHRLRLYNGKIRLEPGSAPGTTNVNVDVEKSKSWWLSTSIDNSGSESTGKTHAATQLDVEDLFGLYDKWTAKLGHDAEPNDSGKRSRDIYAALSIPMGYWTLNLSTQQFDYLSTVKGSSASFLSSGVSRTHTARLDRLIHRDDVGKTTLSADLSSKIERNYVEGLLLESSSRKLTRAGLELSHVRRLWDGVWTGGLTVSHGVPWFGGEADNQRNAGSPKAESIKTVVSTSYSRGFKLADELVQFSSSLTMQHSPSTLHSTEQISAGGLYTVRGFRGQSISGNSGGYIRNELTWLPRFSMPDTATKWLGSSQVFVALDAGWVPDRGNETATPGVVKGFAIGHRLTNGRIVAEIGLEEPLDAPAGFRTERNQFYFKLGFSL